MSAGKTVLSPEDDHQLLELVRLSPFPALLVRLRDHRIIEVSLPAAEWFGTTREELVQTDGRALRYDQLGVDPHHVLSAGIPVDSYHRAAQTYRKRDGSQLTADVWVTAVESPPGSEHAIVVFTELGQHEPGLWARVMPAPTTLAVVVGCVDAEWCIDQISEDVSALLGGHADAFLGRPLASLLHPDDVGGLHMALGHAMQRPGGAAALLRLRTAHGTWLMCRALITPLVGRRPGFAFVIRSGGAADAPDRVHELEEQLRRIAFEVRAAGVAAAFVSLPTSRDVPAIGTLSTREYGILAQLDAGQRVPAIARTLFMSESTVRNHLTSVFRKFGVASQQELLDLLHAGRERGPEPGGSVRSHETESG